MVYSAVMPRFKRGIQYSRDGSALARSRGVLDCPVKPGNDGFCGKNYIRITAWRSILPVPVFGSSPMNLISRGYLYGSSLALT
jgi:hypothetical protein